MKYNKLGTTDIDVSLTCLGTMTWGAQNTEADGHAQMDYALERGINFFDTAELYSIPPTPETRGSTERIIGTWFKKTGHRDKVILATKIAGSSSDKTWLRGGKYTFDRINIEAAVNDSLARLNTDYIDLYQLHWPSRKVNNFGTLDYDPSDFDSNAAEGILETLHVLEGQVKSGKIRHIGLSNETAWGMMTFLKLAKAHNLPRMQTVQNAYSLLNRTHEINMAEVSMFENCGLLAYSPLARGYLSGKYLGGHIPEKSSKAYDNRKSRYDNDRAEHAIQGYVAIAEEFGMDPCQMALSFVNQQPFVTSNIIGATSLEQLKTNIDSIHVTLPTEVITAINAVHHSNPNPSEQ